MKFVLRPSEAAALPLWSIMLSHKVKLSVPLTPAGTSRCEASLHAPKVCLSCRKAHLVEKNHPLSTFMMDTAKSIDCILNLLSDITPPPIRLYYIIKIYNKRHSVKFGFRPSEAAALPLWSIMLSHKVKLSVPLTPAGTSRCEASLHAPKVCLSCRKAHLVEKNSITVRKYR